MTDNDLILKALGVARTLSYNDSIQGPAKHVIRELAHRLDRNLRREKDAANKAHSLMRWLVDTVHRAMGRNRRKGT